MIRLCFAVAIGAGLVGVGLEARFVAAVAFLTGIYWAVGRFLFLAFVTAADRRGSGDDVPDQVRNAAWWLVAMWPVVFAYCVLGAIGDARSDREVERTIEDLKRASEVDRAEVEAELERQARDALRRGSWKRRKLRESEPN